MVSIFIFLNYFSSFLSFPDIDTKTKPTYRDEIEKDWRLILHDDTVHTIQQVCEILGTEVYRICSFLFIYFCLFIYVWYDRVMSLLFLSIWLFCLSVFCNVLRIFFIYISVHIFIFFCIIVFISFSVVLCVLVPVRTK